MFVCQMQNKASITVSILLHPSISPLHTKHHSVASQGGCTQDDIITPSIHAAELGVVWWGPTLFAITSLINWAPSFRSHTSMIKHCLHHVWHVMLRFGSSVVLFLLHTSLSIIDHSDMSSWLHVLKESDFKLFVNLPFQSHFNLSFPVLHVLCNKYLDYIGFTFCTVLDTQAGETLLILTQTFFPLLKKYSKTLEVANMHTGILSGTFSSRNLPTGK